MAGPARSGARIAALRCGVLAAMLLAAGCAAERPVVYPTARVAAVGAAAVQADVDACIAFAESSGASADRPEKVAKDTAANAAIGAGTGAAVGAAAGNGAGRGAAIGAAGVGAGTLLRGAFRSPEPAPIHRRFVERCLSDRGYDVLGWE